MSTKHTPLRDDIWRAAMNYVSGYGDGERREALAQLLGKHFAASDAMRSALHSIALEGHGVPDGTAKRIALDYWERAYKNIRDSARAALALADEAEKEKE